LRPEISSFDVNDDYFMKSGDGSVARYLGSSPEMLIEDEIEVMASGRDSSGRVRASLGS
jgi:hypothetical protein